MNLLSKLLLSALVITGMVLANLGGVAQAHVLKQNNGVSGELHMPPNDNPKAGEPTSIELAFSDQQNAFSLQDCNCSLSLEQNGKVLQSVSPGPSFEDAALEGTATINFPNIGTYNIIVSGTAKNGAFATFKLEYEVHVPRGVGAAQAVAAKNSSSITPVFLGLGIFALVAIMGYAAISVGGRLKN